MAKLVSAQAKHQSLPASFGAEMHQYRMNPPITEDQLQRFEAEHGIELPGDYRTFLAVIGNGGAGPYYGVVPLESWAEAASDVFEGYLRSPCPLSPDMPRTADWEDLLPSSAIDRFQGTITICHQGCAYYTLLIVSGPARGRVVYVDEDGQPPYFPENADFLSWYERWLDELLAGYDLGWFGFGVPGSEEDLLHALVDPATSPERRAKLLSALLRLPRLSDATADVVRVSFRDSSAEVRVGAANVAGKFPIPGSRDAVRVLLDDADSAVRLAALDCFVGLSPVDWDTVRLRLRDPDRAVVRQALFKMQDAGTLTVDDVRPVLNSADPWLRKTAVYCLGHIAGADSEALLLGYIDDAEIKVRINVIQALAKLRSTRALPALEALLTSDNDQLLLTNVIRAMVEIGDKRVVPLLRAATTHVNPRVRADAVWALGQLHDRRTVPMVPEVLKKLGIRH